MLTDSQGISREVLAPDVTVDASRRLLAAVTLALGAVLVLLLSFRHPGELALPTCPLHWATGLHCPGCGSLRALHFLLQGEWLLALRYNLLAIILLPLIAWLWVAEVTQAFGRRFPLRSSLSARASWLLLAAILLFGVARNLPARPFSTLSPPPTAMQTLDLSGQTFCRLGCVGSGRSARPALAHGVLRFANSRFETPW
jgi:hypothetical protein